MADKNKVQWWAFLIGKIRESDLSSENKLKLEQERAVREAQNITGEVPIKRAWDWITGGEDDEK